MASTAGLEFNLSYSLAYAPPEVIQALEAHQRVLVADASADMWALGVIAFELLSKQQTFPFGTRREAVFAAISGRVPLPWERPELEAQRAADLRGLRRSIMLCLSRDPAQRPSAARLLAVWNHMFDSWTSVSGGTSEVVPVGRSAFDGAATPAEGSDGATTDKSSPSTTVPS